MQEIGVGLLGVLLAWAAVEARSQGIDNPDSVRPAVVTDGRKPVQIAVVNNLDRTCAIGTQPALKVPGLPKHGKIIARTVEIATGKNNRCPGQKTQGQLVVYEANPSYVGPDEVTIAVHAPDGEIRTATIRITVTGDALPQGQQQL